MRAFLRLVLFVSLTAIASQVPAQANDEVRSFVRSADLLAMCTADEDLGEYTFCMGYVTAIADSILWQGESFIYCIPPGIEVGEIVDAVVAYLRVNRDMGTMPAASQVYLALAFGFPCT